MESKQNQSRDNKRKKEMGMEQRRLLWYFAHTHRHTQMPKLQNQVMLHCDFYLIKFREIAHNSRIYNNISINVFNHSSSKFLSLATIISMSFQAQYIFILEFI